MNNVFHFLIYLFCRSVVELLISRGGDLTIGERTPLFEACQEGHYEVAQHIVNHLRKSYNLQVGFVTFIHHTNQSIHNLAL